MRPASLVPEMSKTTKEADMEKINELKAANDLLQAALFALNSITNTPLKYGNFNKTYDLAAAIEKHLGKAGA